MRLKAAGSMPVLGLMPSGKPRAAWATWLQDLVTHRGHVAADLMVWLACCCMLPVPAWSFLHRIFAIVALSGWY